MPYRPISARADGLLSLLGIKNLGRNPDLLMESVQPVLDAQGWYLRSSAVGYSGTGPFGFIGENVFPAELLASDQEWLYIHYAQFQIFGLAAGNPFARVFVFRNTPGNAQTLWSSGRTASQLIAGVDIAEVQVRDIWIPPGAQLGFAGDDNTVGDTWVWGAQVSRVLV